MPPLIPKRHFGEKFSVFGSRSSVKRGGVPSFSVKKLPLTFPENLVRDGPGGGEEGTPLTENFRDWGY